MQYQLQFTALVAAATVVSATPMLKNRNAQFTVNQISTGKTSARNGPGAYAKALQKFHGNVPSNVQAAAAQTSGTVTNNPSSGDEQYTCPVEIGTPAQTLNLDFDTGSSDLWVFSSETPSQDVPSGSNIYTPSDSSTSSQEQGESWTISYGDGSGASGDVYADQVVVGGVTATSQAVEAATSVSSGSFSGNDGLLGLASSSINTVTPNQATTWFDTVKGQLDSALFTATLKHNEPGSYDFGYIDSSKYSGSISYAPVDFSQGFWQFNTDSYSVSGGSGGDFGSAIADTGTTLLLANDDDVLTNYYGQVQGAQNSSQEGGYVFPCDSTLPDLIISIGGQDITISGSLINFAEQNGQCFGGLQSANGLGFSILGDVFLKSVFAVFDEGNSQFGVAPQA